MKKAVLFVMAALLLCSFGCGAEAETLEPFLCRVVLEEGAGFTAQSYAAQTVPGGELRFDLRVEDGYTVTGADYDGCVLEHGPGGGVVLVLPEVCYSTAVRLNVERVDTALAYHANGGVRLDGGNSDKPVEVPVTPSHLRWNTSTGAGLF